MNYLYPDLYQYPLKITAKARQTRVCGNSHGKKQGRDPGKERAPSVSGFGEMQWPGNPAVSLRPGGSRRPGPKIIPVAGGNTKRADMAESANALQDALHAGAKRQMTEAAKAMLRGDPDAQRMAAQALAEGRRVGLILIKGNQNAARRD